MEELATVAMFGGGKRLVVVENADEGRAPRGAKGDAPPAAGAAKREAEPKGFVARCRTQLEDYVAKPRPTGVLVLEVKSFPSNTRLYKAVAAAGLLIDCAEPKPAVLTRWLGVWAKQTHRVELPAAAANMLVELIGPELGLLDQEIAKLALMTGDKKRITSELVAQSAGGWRVKTVWDMLDAALDGNAREALDQLDRLLAAGEQPVGLMAQIASPLRRMAAATRLVLRGEATGRRTDVRQALIAAGVVPFRVGDAEKRLRRIGRQRGAQLYRWLLEADLDLKGDSALPPRLVLERLLLRLAAK
jgi:DNA polymerase-3 subunit delta